MAINEVSQHQKVGLVRAQARALREMVAAGRNAELEEGPHDIGIVLAGTASAGFALELGLKAFYMTFFRDGAPKSHKLKDLFDALDEPIKADIRRRYQVLRPLSARHSVGLRFSPNSPLTPNRGTYIGSVETADELFATATDAFVYARYFYERVNSDDWTVMTDNVPFLLAMSETLERVYAEYAARGHR